MEIISNSCCGLEDDEFSCMSRLDAICNSMPAAPPLTMTTLMDLESAKKMVVEAAVGVASQQLWEIVRDLATQPHRFREQYRRLEQDLASLKPMLARLPPAELNDVLRRGGELIEKCGKVFHWNFLKQKKYSRRLKKLDEEIDRFVRMKTLRELQQRS
ncbi:hypothetical protein EJ110_NYTH58750 [Nymphaea thermarum]|nr:hypothetical protein EJ110_NYTH58750 [Nymphaea thermarum]